MEACLYGKPDFKMKAFVEDAPGQF